MARPTDKEIFLRALRAQNGRAGNTALQRELKWDEAKYWEIHEQLYEEGIIEKGKGCGGTVILRAVDPAATGARCRRAAHRRAADALRIRRSSSSSTILFNIWFLSTSPHFEKRSARRSIMACPDV